MYSDLRLRTENVGTVNCKRIFVNPLKSHLIVVGLFSGDGANPNSFIVEESKFRQKLKPACCFH